MSVPALRFKEFSGDWEHISLGEISKDVKYGMNSAAIPFDGFHKYIRITDIDEETREFIPSPLSSPDGKVEEKYKLKIGDLVFARTGASVGKSYLYKEKDGDLYFAGFLIKISIVGYHPYFIYTKTLTQAYKCWLSVMSMRSGQPGVNAEELKEYSFLSPSLPEQTKIANFLTAVDQKITLLTQKADLLSQYKKGVMQQIFKQELRFKDDDGQEFPEWEKRKLTDLSKTFIGLVTTMTTSYVENGVCLIRNSDIKQNKIKKIGLIKLDVNFANQHKNRMLRINDVVTVHTGDVGVSAVIDESLDGCLGFATLNTRITSELLSPHYLCWFFNSHEYLSFALSMSTGDGRCNFNLKDFDVSLIPVPHIKEQTKIANFLTAIDEKITINQTQLNAVKQYKQGLLQQMFV